MTSCKQCGSHAINPHRHGRDNTDLDLCDVCYWRTRAEALQCAVENLVAQKGRHNTELAYKRLVDVLTHNAGIERL